MTVADTEGATQAAAAGLALANKGSVPAITCNDAEIYEAAADFTLDCSVTDEPSDATYAWTARGSTSGTSELSSTTVLKPTFSVPDDIDESGGADKDYEYTVTMSAGGVEQASEDVTVTVLEKPDIGCTRWNASSSYNNLDGSLSPGGTWRFDICLGDFKFIGAPDDTEYVFEWTGVETECCTPEIALAHLNRTDVEEPVFTAPTASPYDGNLFFTYKLTVSAENADPVTISPIGASVDTEQRPQLSITCSDDSPEVDAGDPDFDLDCEAAGRWSDSFTYTWQWSPTDHLTEHGTGTPTFDVPSSVDDDTTYTYTVSVSAQNHLSATETVKVTVRNTDPSLTCTDSEVYEAAADITLDCSVRNEPSGATYSWAGTDVAINLLSSTTILKPTFSVLDDVPANVFYEYTVTMSATGIDDISEDVTVTILEKPDIKGCSDDVNITMSVDEGSGGCPAIDLHDAHRRSGRLGLHIYLVDARWNAFLGSFALEHGKSPASISCSGRCAERYDLQVPADSIGR